MIMIVKTPGSQMCSPAVAEGGGEARGGGREECGERIGVGCRSKLGSTAPKRKSRTRQKLKKLRTQIYMDLRYIHPQARVLNYLYK